MESSRKGYDLELLPKDFKDVMIKVKENLLKKTEEYRKELEDQKKFVVNSFITHYNSISDIKKKNEKLDESELKLLETHEEEMKTFISNLDQMTLNEVIKNKVLENVDSHEGTEKKDNYLEELPAHLCPKDRCKSCRTKLVYNKGCYQYYNNCNNTDICNTNYRYYCPTCAIRFCTQCVHPPKIEFCGCGNQLSIQNAPYHSCDICRESITDNCHRCSSCDYDVCFRCFDRIKAEEFPDGEETEKESKDTTNLEKKDEVDDSNNTNKRKSSFVRKPSI